MVYYVRFLKTPRLQKGKKEKAGLSSISALICLTTDLGDAFLAQDVDLSVSLHLYDTGTVLYHESVKWTAGKRELPISLGPFAAQISQKTLALCVSTPHAPNSPDNLLSEDLIPLVISGWSAPFGGSQPLVAEKLVHRRLTFDNCTELAIWEETGNSLARHIWDAAIAAALYLQQIKAGSSVGTAPVLQELLCKERDTPLHAIELGSGCGIVGIALAQLVRQSSVLLTDLPEVEDIVNRNIASSRPARSSEVAFRTLDWDEKLTGDLCGGQIDLVLVSDCTYNADSLPALVSVLDQLLQMSPDAIILVALKRRHESESIFFDLMKFAGLDNLSTDHRQLPSQHDQSDQIELHCYGRAERHPRLVA